MDRSDAQIADLPGKMAASACEDIFAGHRCSRGSIFCWLIMACAALGCIGLYMLSRHNYLLFHSLVEIFSVVVAFTVFSIGWHAQKIHRNNVLLVFAVAFLLVGGLGFLHALSYRGMGVFPAHDADLAARLGIAARFVESLSYVGAALVLGYHREIPARTLLGVCLLLGGLLTWATIHPLDIFSFGLPVAAQTLFKVYSGYVIAALLFATIFVFWRKRNRLNRKIAHLLIASIIVTLLSELSFTPHGVLLSSSNIVGHLLKLLSMILVYVALVQGSLRTPYESLFRDLVKSKEALDRELFEHCETEAKLIDTNRELDAFVRTVSHDLRLPLSPIIGLSGYLREKLEGYDDPEVHEGLATIENQGLRMFDLLEDLLALARIGRLKRPAEPVESEKILDQVLIELGSRIVEQKADVRKMGVPDVHVHPTLVYQVLLNLVGNAVRYAGRQGSPIEIGGERLGPKVRFYVRDHGPGIDDENRERLFQVFFRGRQGRNGQGTGVGLATVQKIARLHDGRAWVDDTPGGGATFCVEFRDT